VPTIRVGYRGHLDQVTPDLGAGTEDHDPGPQRLGLSLRGCRLHKRKLGVGWRDSLVEGFAGNNPIHNCHNTNATIVRIAIIAKILP